MYIFVANNIQVRAHSCEVGQQVTHDRNWRWVLTDEDPCTCTSLRLGGVNTDSPRRPHDPKDMDKPLISDDVEKIRSLLGLECSPKGERN